MPYGLSRTSLCFLGLAVATAWLCLSLPVFSQEAYYWTYAQHPDLSYFDHPPMVAWLIWIGTKVLGHGAMGIRLGTWACGLVSVWIGWRLLRAFGVDEKGQNAWILAGVLSPILAMTHFLANPDPPLVCFWTLTMYALWRARDGGAMGWWILAGTAAGGALLSKYTAIFLAAGGVLLFVFDPRMRRQLRRPGPYTGVFAAAVVFLPVVVWNVRNDFESFRFQGEGRFANATFGVRYFFEMVGGQFGVLHPALAVLLPFALLWLARRAVQNDARALWLLAFGLPLPLYLLGSSLWIQVKINWLAPAYVPLLLGIIVWWRESRVTVTAPRWLRYAAVSLLLVPLALPLAPFLRMVRSGHGSSWAGWEHIAERAEIWEDRIDPDDGVEGNVFFFGADYRDSAQLCRGLRLYWDSEGEHPEGSVDDGGEPTLAQNVLSMRALQFDHWELPGGRIGQDAIFVLTRPEQRTAMVECASKHFHGTEMVERVEVRRLGVHVLDADIYVCRGYRGPDPGQ